MNTVETILRATQSRADDAIKAGKISGSQIDFLRDCEKEHNHQNMMKVSTLTDSDILNAL